MGKLLQETKGYNTEYLFDELLEKLKNTSNLNLDNIREAFDLARKFHEGQIRASKEPYITHPVEVAKILADLHMDTNTIVTALLHDTIEDTELTYEDILGQFGKEVADMVQGTTKLTYIEEKLCFLTQEEKTLENYRNLICAVSKDIRVLIIKLADRLHNMRTLHYITNQNKRKRIAMETMDIHAALAERIGIHSFKNDLQELAFSELYRKEKRYIEKQLEELGENRDYLVKEIEDILREALEQSGMSDILVSGREKKICSIWMKLKNKKISFENLSDIFAFRIVTKNLKACYEALGIVHNKFQIVPGYFKDYISIPKINGYKSLHTIVIGPKNKKIEVQIKTEEMHEIAEYGIAAHWQYKQNIIEDDKNFKWINEILAILQNTANPSEVLQNSKLEMEYHQIFCFTPKGKLIVLPKDSTVLDFAFYIHSNIGLRFISAYINKEIVPMHYRIRNGDQIEIIYEKDYKALESWNAILQTGKAKSELKKYFNEIKKNKKMEEGKAKFFLYLDRLHISYEELNLKFPMVYKTHNIEDIDKLFVSIGREDFYVKDLIRDIYPYFTDSNFFKILIKKLHRLYKYKIKNQNEYQIKISSEVILPKCCFPIRGDKCMQLIDEKNNITIHRKNCLEIKNADRSLNFISSFSWKDRKELLFNVKIIVLISNKSGSFRAVTNQIFLMGINIFNISTASEYEDFFECSVVVEVVNLDQLNKLMSKFKTLENVYSIRRYIDS
ncbi:MAG: guanosine-3',5'-bis(diphosphate) 3'-pyrophosphohydrolase [Candidatus Midichloriaceae bacterium]|jgi:guanosine-3',5'-bis(diphosphate) 3'-pyrophosphohydrolase